MPVPPLLRALLFGMFDDLKLASAVAHAFITEDNMTQRAIAREFGVDEATLRRAIKEAQNKVANYCENEEILPEELLVINFTDSTRTELGIPKESFEE